MFDFNTYSGLLLPASINGLLFAILCFWRYQAERRYPDLFLGLLLVLLTIRLSFWMLGFAGWYDRHNGLTSLMFYFPFNTLVLIGPCLYFYFLSLTNRDFKPKFSAWPHLVLPLLLLLLYLGKFAADFLFYRPFPKTEAYQFGTRGPFAELDKSGVVYLVSYASLLFYFALTLRRFRHYKAYLLDHFAGLESIELGWLKGLIWFTIVSILALLSFFIADLFIPLNYIFNWYPYLLLGFLIYYISIKGYFQPPNAFRHLQFTPVVLDVPLKAAALQDMHRWKQNLEELIELEQPYLDPELNLSLLAKKLGTNTQILSRLINEGYGQNFNDYVNSLRVKAVIEQFKSNAHEKYSLMGIAYDCGFNSKTTFGRAFRKVTGQTPTLFLQELAGSDHHLNP